MNRQAHDSVKPVDKDSEQAIPWITLKDLMWLGYLYPARWVSRVSIPFINLLFRLVEPFFQVFSAPRKEHVESKLRILFGAEMPALRLKAMARQYVSNFVRRAGDDLRLLRHSPHVYCRSFRGREHLDAALAAGNGVVLVSLHWFAGRLANQYLESIGYPVLTVRNKYPSDDLMGRLGRKFLQPRYVSFLHEVINDEVFTQDRECSLKILRRLRSGGIVNINLDGLKSRHVIVHPFLGEPCRFPVGFFQFARVCKSTVLPMLAIGSAEALEIRIDPSPAIDHSLSVDRLRPEDLSPLVVVLESYVREHPDQWELWTRL